jgi:hypothetical protein
MKKPEAKNLVTLSLKYLNVQTTDVKMLGRLFIVEEGRENIIRFLPLEDQVCQLVERDYISTVHPYSDHIPPHFGQTWIK